jgi:hypothetical protein
MTFPPTVGRWACGHALAVRRCPLRVGPCCPPIVVGRRPPAVAQPLLTADRGPLGVTRHALAVRRRPLRVGPCCPPIIAGRRPPAVAQPLLTVGRGPLGVTRHALAVRRRSLRVGPCCPPIIAGRQPSPVAQPSLAARRGPLVPSRRPSAPQDRPRGNGRSSSVGHHPSSAAGHVTATPPDRPPRLPATEPLRPGV